MTVSVQTAVLVTHMHPPGTADAVRAAAAAAETAGVTLLATGDELDKHGEAAAGIVRVDEAFEGPDLCLVLGGDGSILHALRRFAHTGVPVFGINFGTIGFLAASEREELDDALRRAFAGEFEVMTLPGLELGVEGTRPVALNDVTFVRQPHGRVAELSYRLADEEVGHVRCDGLVVATPAGSTGYNLANAGPILAWGVEGYVVSFIAPHTLTARALVVAPGDALHVSNGAGREPVEIELDGDHCSQLEPGAEIEVRFRHDVGRLAQYEDANFYHRIREKFGRLAR
ncbi:MAG TPA: NAD(+)/NADH kinase [Solirubrobacterales bacterium]|nr:NAD(+)/NADH kinase [Solirubrobacterales bacterium]